MKKIVLIDGYSIINRAFYGLPLLTNAQGEHTNGVYGFINIMLKVFEEEKPDYAAVAFDVKAPTFRHEMFQEYKGTRKPMPTELTQQVPMLKDLLQAMEIACVEKTGLEADDIIGTLANMCRKEGLDVVIVSGDRDLLQLATDNTMVRIPKTKSGKTEIYNYYAKDVLEEYGVTPIEFIDMKALMGDASDNIPGLPGVGPKTASAIIQKYHTIENAWEHREEITPNKAKTAFCEHYDLAQLSKKLATIEVNAALDFQIETAMLKKIFTPQAYEIIKRHNFKSLFGKFEEQVKAATVTQLPETVILEDFAEAAACFSAAGSAEQVGVAVAAEDSTVYGAALYFGDRLYYIPVQGFMTEEYIRQEFSSLCQTASHVVAFGVKELLGYFPEEALDTLITHMDDISLMAYLINPLKSSYTYEELAEHYLELTLPSYGEVFGKNSFPQMQMMAPAAMADYFAAQAYVSFQLKEVLQKVLQETEMLDLYQTVELPLILCLYRMEQEGVRVDGTALKEYGDHLGSQIVLLEEEIYRLCGTTFNINSPKQLGEVLFETMGLPGGKKTKSGYSTAADVLEKLAPDHEVIRKILDYRQLTKLKSTYADGLAVFIGADGRIHGKFNQMITATGRISSTEPNLQNIPVRMELGRKIRKVFIPKEGCVFVDADYSQIELRVLAHMSGDENLIEAYNTAADIHAITASQVFHVPLDQITPQLRRNAKAVNFGIVYGISAFGLSEDLSISRKEASSYIERYFEAYPDMKKFLDRLVSDAKEKGYSKTMLGRRRPIPELTSSNFMQRSFGERVAMNAPIQGTAADIMKLAMLKVDQELRRGGFSARIILQVHDELLLEVPEQETEAVKQLLINCMQSAVDLRVKLEVSAEIGKNWYETK